MSSGTNRTGMDEMEDVDLGQHIEIVEEALSEEFTLIDAERPDDNRVITVIAGSEKARIPIPRTLTCTLSPVMAGMMQKAFEEQRKNHGAFEHVPRFDKGGSLLKDDDNILDFASQGQSRLRNPTLVLSDWDAETVTALAYWLDNPEASILSDVPIRRVLRFNLRNNLDNLCGCGRVPSFGLFPRAIHCAEHDPSIAIGLICLAEKFQMTKLRQVVTKGLLRSCGIWEIIEEDLGRVGYSHSIIFRRWVADPSNSKNAIQYFRLTGAPEDVKHGFLDFEEGKYKISGLRKGTLEGNDGGIEREALFWGGFEVYLEVHSVTQESFVSKLRKAVLGN